MSVLIDREIRRLSIGDGHNIRPLEPLLEPFSEPVQGKGVVSSGLTHAGYDLRLGHKVLVFKNTRNVLIDPKRMKQDAAYKNMIFDEIDGLKDGDQVVIPPNSYILGYSLEYIRMPRNLKGTAVGKSTLARCGILLNTTPIEPGWHGNLTLEIANVTPCPVALYVAEGCCQLEFHTLSQEPDVDYDQKAGGGKYQGQSAEPVPARVKE